VLGHVLFLLMLAHDGCSTVCAAKSMCHHRPLAGECLPSAFVPFGHLGCGSSAQGASGANMAGGRAMAGVTMPDVDGRLKIGL
jgi:hypothetical protein